MAYNARPYVLYEASLKQVQALKPNVALLPWGATEGHNFHLPHGTDCIQATAVAEAAMARAVARGARCILLPTMPFGNDNLQLDQAATITMRSRTQQAVLHDICESLTRQGIRRLVVLNYHGGNDFKQMIRDIMMDLPIFIAQYAPYLADPKIMQVPTDPSGDHANEFETAMMMHLTPDWVAPKDQWGDGAFTKSTIPSLTGPGAWAPRDWAALTKDTGTGNPQHATADKGARMFEMMVVPTAQLLVELSAAKEGDFPLIVRDRRP